MGRRKTGTVKISPALLRRTPATVELTPDILADYGARVRQLETEQLSVGWKNNA